MKSSYLSTFREVACLFILVPNSFHITIIINSNLLSIFQNSLFSFFSFLKSFQHFPFFSKIFLIFSMKFFQYFSLVSILYIYVYQYITMKLIAKNVVEAYTLYIYIEICLSHNNILFIITILILYISFIASLFHSIKLPYIIYSPLCK